LNLHRVSCPATHSGAGVLCNDGSATLEGLPVPHHADAHAGSSRHRRRYRSSSLPTPTESLPKTLIDTLHVFGPIDLPLSLARGWDGRGRVGRLHTAWGVSVEPTVCFTATTRQSTQSRKRDALKRSVCGHPAPNARCRDALWLDRPPA
jgi:hypothetical protein